MLAAVHGQHEAVALLMDNGADPNAPDTTTGCTPLMMAASAAGCSGVEMPEMAQLLLDKGAAIEWKHVPTGKDARPDWGD